MVRYIYTPIVCACHKEDVVGRGGHFREGILEKYTVTKRGFLICFSCGWFGFAF